MDNLIQRRSAALKDNEAIALRVQAEGRPFNHEETRKIAENFSLADELETTIVQARKIAESVAPVAAPAPTLADGGAGRPEYRTMKDVRGREHVVFARGQKMSDYYGRGDGMTLQDFGNGLAAMISGDTRKYAAEVRALSSTTNSGGGFLVTEELSSQLVDLARERSVMMQAGCQTVSMETSDLRLVRLLTDVTVAQYSEGAAITPSDPSFDSILLVADKLATLTYISNELAADGANAGEAIIDSIVAAMARAQDDYLLTALLNSTQIVTTGSIGAIQWSDVLAARLAVKLLNGQAPSIVANPNLMYDLSLLTESTTGAFLAPPAQVADLTWYETTAMAADTAVTGDFSKLLCGMRQGLTLELSRDARFNYDETAIRCISRMAANVTRPHFHIMGGIS